MNIIELKFFRAISFIGILSNIFPIFDKFQHIDNNDIWLIIIANIVCFINVWWTNNKIRDIRSKKQVVKILDTLLEEMREEGVTNLKDLKRNKINNN